MDKKELLTQVVDSIVNEDDAAASEAFKKYATAKVRGILEGVSKKKDATCTVEDGQEEQEQVAAEVIDKSNKDD